MIPQIWRFGIEPANLAVDLFGHAHSRHCANYPADGRERRKLFLITNFCASCCSSYCNHQEKMKYFPMFLKLLETFLGVSFLQYVPSVYHEGAICECVLMLEMVQNKTWLQWTTNRKSCPDYKLLPLPVTLNDPEGHVNYKA